MCLTPIMASPFTQKIPLNPNAKPFNPHSSHLQETEDQLNNPEMFSFFPIQIPYSYYKDPCFEVYYQPEMLENSQNDTVVNNTKVLGYGSEELKQLSWINSHESPRQITMKKFVPPRFRKKGYYFQDFRGKKNQKPGNYRYKKVVPSASNYQQEEFLFDNCTSVMMKNVPNQYRRDSFIKFLDKCCLDHQLEFDFLYLPMDFKRGANLGYAFVNFTSTNAANKMREAFNGYKWEMFATLEGTFSSKKVLEIKRAKIQGKDALERHFWRSNFWCDNKEYLPVVISPPGNGFTSISSLTPIGNLQGRLLENLIK